MSKFYFNGEIVSKGFDKMNNEDVCVADFQKFLDGLQDDEPIELYFSSLGGDVLAGQQMISMLKDAERKGHATTANVTSIAASMASVVACACQTLKLYEGAYLMCHLPWTMAIGNTNDLEKEIATLNQLKNGMVKIYKTKFDLSDDEIDAMLSAETWIDADNYKDWKLNCEIVENGEPLKIAASLNEKHFKNIPKRILDMKNKAENVSAEETLKEEIVEEVTEEKQEQELTPEEEKKVEEVIEEVTEEKTEEEKTPEELKKEIETLTNRIAELEKENEELKAKCGEEKAEDVSQDETEKVEKKTEEEVVTKAEADKRVSGMQASMQKQVNALTTDLTNFKSQLQAKEEELTKAKAEITSLNDSLKKSNEELSAMASTLEEKTQALDKLNASVNAQAEELPTMKDGLAKCATPAEKVAFLKSGKYIR